MIQYEDRPLPTLSKGYVAQVVASAQANERPLVASQQVPPERMKALLEASRVQRATEPTGQRWVDPKTIVRRNPVGTGIVPVTVTPFEFRLRQIERLIEEMKEFVENGDKANAAFLKRVRIVGSQLLTMAERIKQGQTKSAS